MTTGSSREETEGEHDRREARRKRQGVGGMAGLTTSLAEEGLDARVESFVDFTLAAVTVGSFVLRTKASVTWVASYLWQGSTRSSPSDRVVQRSHSAEPLSPLLPRRGALAALRHSENGGVFTGL
eukprot:scaffold79907_cov34-Tisochrysis_lutea.AAC.5